jgi:hypothetical protein
MKLDIWTSMFVIQGGLKLCEPCYSDRRHGVQCTWNMAYEKPHVDILLKGWQRESENSSIAKLMI